jgi:GDPmannose 4,6-dehydratase
MFAANGILFNHESPIRGETFVTRKITRAVVNIALGIERKLFIGNLNAKRDWGHAKDFVEAMYLILQQKEPDDFVIATGRTTAVRDFIRLAFREIGIEIAFQGENSNEIGMVDKIDLALFEAKTKNKSHHLKPGQTVIEVDKKYYRPTEVELLVGDASKAREKLGWSPKHSLEDLVRDMIEGDLEIAKRKKFLRDQGHEILESMEW